jgi:hypothetical protein
MRSPFTLDWLRRRTGIAAFILIGVVGRALIPAGFMPAALAAGGPVVVCHGGLAGEFFRQVAVAQSERAAEHNAAALRDAQTSNAEHGPHAGHDAHADQSAHADVDRHVDDGPHPDHGDVDEARHEAWEHCPVGATFAAALLSGDLVLPLLDFDDVLESREPVLPVRAVLLASYRARAPPLLSA